MADYQLVDATEEVVLGVDSQGVSYILRPEGKFTTSNENVMITGVWLLVYPVFGSLMDAAGAIALVYKLNVNLVQAETNTAELYVDLAISLGGAAWAIRILENITLQESFTSALIETKLREIKTIIESCRM